MPLVSAMKRILKPVLITLLSLLVLVVLLLTAACVALFKTQLLSNLVNEKAGEYLTCEYHIGKIEPTLFKTFPRFSLQIEDLFLQDEMAEVSGNDTLLYVGEVLASVDVMSLLKQQELKVDELRLQHLLANVYVDENDSANYQVFAFSSDTVSEEDDTTSFSLPFALMELDKVSFKDLNISYIDKSSQMAASLSQWNLQAKLKMAGTRLSAQIDTRSEALSFAMGDTLLVDAQPISAELPLEVELSDLSLDTRGLILTLGQIALTAKGQVAMDQAADAIRCDLQVQLGQDQEPIANYLALVPTAYQSLLEEISIDGRLGLQAQVQGCYTTDSMPLVDCDLRLYDTNLSYTGLPPVQDIQTDIHAHLDLNDERGSYAQLNQLSLKANRSGLQAKARVDELLSDNMKVKAQASLDAPLEAWQGFLPDSLEVQGNIKADATLALSMKDLDNTVNLSRIALQAQLDYDKLKVAMGDMQAVSDQGGCHLALRPGQPDMPILLQLQQIQGLQLQTDSMQAALENLNVQLQLSDVLADSKHIKAELALDFAQADLQPSQDLQVNTEAFRLKASVAQDAQYDNLLYSLNPTYDIYLQEARINTGLIPEGILVSDVQSTCADDIWDIQHSSVVLGNSDFHLSGHARDIIAYFRDDSLLRADLNFVSDQCDVNRLMELVSGMGNDETEEDESGEAETVAVETEVVDTLAEEASPFIVPKGVDVLLHTHIKKALTGKQVATDLTGDLYVRDGVMILKEIGFVCEAAKLQLTAMYRSPRPNHLYLGLDCHMVDIQIDELIQMAPQIDSVMPMLATFKGAAEWHLAAETYLDAHYNLKKSTLRGATSIKGKDLVVMDGEVFSKISKLMLFNKQTENKIDSVQAEITVFRNEVDVYPLQLSIDKYKAIVAGRHNLDNTFNYHLSLLKPLRVGVDVSGNFDNLKIVPVACRYTDQFHPSERRVVEQQQLSLRKIIQENLVKDIHR